jgi:hypothetical protein
MITNVRGGENSSCLRPRGHSARPFTLMRFRERIGTGYLERRPGYGLGNRGIEVCFRVGARVFSSPQCPERLWGLLNLQ